MYIKNNYQFSEFKFDNHIEQVWIKLKINDLLIGIGVVYKPPDYIINTFIEFFEKSLADMFTDCDEIFCLGDFNVDLLNPHLNPAHKINDLLDSFNLVQIIDGPTHITPTSQTLIDYIIVSNKNRIKSFGVCSLDHITDHELIYCDVNIFPEKPAPIFKTVRNFKHFDVNLFLLDLNCTLFANIYHIENINDKVKFLSSNIVALFDKHAPFKKIKVTKNYNPWLTDNVKLLKSLRDQAKKKGQKTKEVAHLTYNKMIRNYTTLACENEKKAFFQHKLHVGGIKNTWKNLQLINIGKTEHTIPETLKEPYEINQYYTSCIPHLTINQNTIDNYLNTVPNREQFTFTPVSCDLVQKLLYTIKSNALGSDGLNLKMLLNVAH
ncbi:uncharacterized protein [Diabrotica undecimpunctata]|uniref:uncharacterized protein n=1 Tax=Diabrotica undecimpunctata TaxID=50387 RepID=UPI003B63FBCC